MRLLLFLFPFFVSSQIKVYCIPGQGSDARIFEAIQLPASCTKTVLEYGTPGKGETMAEFASRFIERIDTTEDFVLVGHSLGGMLCVELADVLSPRRTIIISSAKSRKDLPFRYRFQRNLPLYRVFPGTFLLAVAKLLQPVVEPDRNKHKKVFKSMLAAKNGKYMKRTIHMIIRWERTTETREIFHIHGDKDHTLPFRNLSKVDAVIPGGSHMITLTRAGEISEILKGLLP
jgi:pimeloyl-ACP methyl ester carboxylesterase